MKWIIKSCFQVKAAGDVRDALLRFGINSLLLIFIVSGHAAAQNRVPFLERTITVSLENISREEALKRISRQGGFTFSYNSTLFDGSEIINIRSANRTVREILDDVFQGKVEYRERGKYIILLKGKEKASSRDAKVVSGYVIDEATGERLKDVSVYDPVTLSSAITDEYGFFKIEIRNPTGDEIRLAVNKVQYTDTILVVPPKNGRLLKIPIRFDKERIESMADSVGHTFRRWWKAVFQATEEAVNMENISDTLYRRKQFSFVPFIGTNGALSGNVINDYSFNLFGGYSLGNRIFELGGLFNAVRGDLRGVQIAGLANGVLGDQQGTQLAGLTNLSGGTVDGVQLAGLANIAGQGAQGGGVAGLGNLSLKDQRGVYLGGMFNIAVGEAGPAQVAGLFNFAQDTLSGVQLSGLANIVTGETKGAQISGLVNLTQRDITGLQLSSLFNMAREVRGTQIALFNYARSIKGIPVGLVSIVAKGYHKLEVSADEIFYTNVAFRTGVAGFHNILTVGARPSTFGEDETTWSFGYGIGAAPRVTKWLSLNVDMTSSQIVRGEIEKINLLNKVYGGFDFHVSKNFSIIAGATLNGLVTDRFYTGYPDLFAGYTPSIIRERNFGDDLNLRMWWGGKVGVRFF